MHGENEVVQLYLDDIIPNRFQPREVFDEKALKELAVSIKEHGVIQPIIVRNIGNKYEIIAGERRYKASALAGLTKIPAIVRNLDDKESSKVALLENLQRKNLNPLEEARTYQKILEIDQMTQEELAKTMGKSQGAVANKLRLLTLSEAVQDALLKEQISERHARTLLNIQDQDLQKQMLKKVIDQKMTVRELEQEINPQGKREESKETPIEQNFNLDAKNDVTAGIPETTIPNISSNMIPNLPQTDAIDYSTPPKFIDYGLDDDGDESSAPDSFESSALTPPDINALRQNAQDINSDVKPAADLDSLLQGTKDSSQQPPQSEETNNFKFFNPNMEEFQATPSQENTKEEKPDLFKAPDLIAVPKEDVSLPNENAFSIPTVQEEEKPPLFNNVNEEKNLYNMDSILNLSSQTKNQGGTLSIQAALDEIRKTVKSLEEKGIKVDIDEMDFDKNYQIILKFWKDDIEK